MQLGKRVEPHLSRSAKLHLSQSELHLPLSTELHLPQSTQLHLSRNPELRLPRNTELNSSGALSVFLENTMELQTLYDHNEESRHGISTAVKGNCLLVSCGRLYMLGLFPLEYIYVRQHR